ncbi:MAG: hypothetical protein ACKOXF_06250, partial [Chitinophagaceae bacterium]
MRFIISAIVFFMVSELQAELFYKISIDNPNSHYAQVDITITGIKTKTVEFKMPVWTPGSYMVREFEKNIDRVVAKAGRVQIHDKLIAFSDKASISKKDKNTWVVDLKGETAVCISYPVYCFEQSVRTSYIDNDHAFLLLTSCLMYPEGFKGAGELQLEFPTSWAKVSTTLELINQNQYRFNNYDKLADSPIEIGNHSKL